MIIHDACTPLAPSGQVTDSGNENDLLTAAQVSGMTGIPVSTLHEYAMRVEAGLDAQGPVHVRLGPRRRRWLRRDVTGWIEERRVVGSYLPSTHARHLAARR